MRKLSEKFKTLLMIAGVACSTAILPLLATGHMQLWGVALPFLLCASICGLILLGDVLYSYGIGSDGRITYRRPLTASQRAQVTKLVKLVGGRAVYDPLTPDAKILLHSKLFGSQDIIDSGTTLKDQKRRLGLFSRVKTQIVIDTLCNKPDVRKSIKRLIEQGIPEGRLEGDIGRKIALNDIAIPPELIYNHLPLKDAVTLMTIAKDIEFKSNTPSGSPSSSAGP